MANGPNLATHIPIIQVQNKANTTPFTYALPEKAAQTFLFGTPLMLNGGYSQAWDGLSFTNAILGISESFGLQLGTDGAGSPTPPWGGITTGYYGGGVPPAISNQPSAVSIPLGQPVSDGRTLFLSPGQDNVFEAIFDTTKTSIAAGDYTPTQADIGTLYGLSKDGNGYWYVDKFKTGGSSCIQIVGINPIDGFIANARVRFVFVPANVVQSF